MTAARAWPTLIAAIAIYEILADDDQLLSRAVDRTRARGPLPDLAVTGAIIITAGHLLRAWRPERDPFRYLGLHR